VEGADEGVRDFGDCLSPQNAFYLLQGLETLPVRMARHMENTRKIVAFLKAAPQVEKVAYPELPDHPDNALAKSLLPKGSGAVFTFDGVTVTDSSSPARSSGRR
jgi:O-acetylhomoserine (thiol)-lyase